MQNEFRLIKCGIFGKVIVEKFIPIGPAVEEIFEFFMSTKLNIMRNGHGIGQNA